MCHNYTILTDNVCELMENTTQFEVRLSVTSTDRLDINSSLSRATVSIDDSREPECCKLCCMLLFIQVQEHSIYKISANAYYKNVDAFHSCKG